MEKGKTTALTSLKKAKNCFDKMEKGKTTTLISLKKANNCFDKFENDDRKDRKTKSEIKM